MAARARSELEWTRALHRRLRDGAYTFADEGDVPQLGPSRGWRGPVETAAPIIKIDYCPSACESLLRRREGTPVITARGAEPQLQDQGRPGRTP